MARPAKPQPFPFSLPVCLALWRTVWAPAFAAAGHDAPLDTSRFSEPRWPVLRVLGPRWLQRQVAQALARRLAWQQQTGWRVPTQYPIAFEISWVELVKDGIDVETRLDMDEEDLRWFVGLELVCMQRLLEATCSVNEACRLRGIAGCSWRLALLYREACRRWGWRQARLVMQEELRCFLGHLAQTG